MQQYTEFERMQGQSEHARLIPSTGDQASDVLRGVLLIYSLVSPNMTAQKVVLTVKSFENEHGDCIIHMFNIVWIQIWIGTESMIGLV